MSNDILVPNIGDFNNVEIIEVLIKEGQEIVKGDTVITLQVFLELSKSFI
jgi:pyruvate/2-oxoglutarate dehydrogenase complex dihydrolipoamide acyltransferase (E2) component